MTRKAIALVLALLIGNPMCCCAMATLYGADPDKEIALPDHSCCCPSVEQDDQEEKPDSCPCFLKKVKSLTLTQTLFLKFTGDDEMAKVLLRTSCHFTLPHLSPVVSDLSKWPPGSFPAPSLRRRIALQCCYLL